MMKLIKKEKIDLGICLIDIYRQPGDLCESWDIVLACKDGSFARAPYAGYGPDAPECRPISDFHPIPLVWVYEEYDHNGHTESCTTILLDSPQESIICHREGWLQGW